MDFVGTIESKKIIEFSSSAQSEIDIKPIRVAIFKQNPQTVVLKIPISRDIPIGEHRIVLSANIFGKGIKVEPQEIILDIQVLPYQFLVSNELTVYIMLILVLIGFLICGYLNLIRLKQKQRWNVKGKITCYKGQKNIEKSINLSKFRKQRIRIASRMEWEPDIFINLDESLMFEIYTENNAIKASSMLGLKYRPRYFVEANLWDTAKELKNGEIFALGKYHFVYHNKKRRIMNTGKDVLKKFEIVG